MLSELMDELIEDSPFLRQIRDQAASRARQEGRAEGRQEGRAEGRQEGQSEEARALVRDVAAARSFDLQNELEGLARLSNLAQLHALVRALVAAPDVETAREALRRALDESSAHPRGHRWHVGNEGKRPNDRNAPLVMDRYLLLPSYGWV